MTESFMKDWLSELKPQLPTTHQEAALVVAPVDIPDDVWDERKVVRNAGGLLFPKITNESDLYNEYCQKYPGPPQCWCPNGRTHLLDCPEYVSQPLKQLLLRNGDIRFLRDSQPSIESNNGIVGRAESGVSQPYLVPGKRVSLACADSSPAIVAKSETYVPQPIRQPRNSIQNTTIQNQQLFSERSSAARGHPKKGKGKKKDSVKQHPSLQEAGLGKKERALDRPWQAVSAE